MVPKPTGQANPGRVRSQYPSLEGLHGSIPDEYLLAALTRVREAHDAP
jgi:hypothetical protein